MMIKQIDDDVEQIRCIIKKLSSLLLMFLQLYLVGPLQVLAAPLGQYLVANQVLPTSTRQARLTPAP